MVKFARTRSNFVYFASPEEETQPYNLAKPAAIAGAGLGLAGAGYLGARKLVSGGLDSVEKRASELGYRAGKGATMGATVGVSEGIESVVNKIPARAQQDMRRVADAASQAKGAIISRGDETVRAIRDVVPSFVEGYNSPPAKSRLTIAAGKAGGFLGRTYGRARKALRDNLLIR